MRELMIKLIICLMIMFACVSCSSDDDLNEYTRQRCLVDDIEMKWGSENVLFEKQSSSNGRDLWVSQIVRFDNYMLQEAFYLKQATKPEELEIGAIYVGSFERDSIIIFNSQPNEHWIGRIFVSCQHHHKCSYHD